VVDAGGLVGYNAAGAAIANVYSLGSVTGVANLGGLIGVNYGFASAGYALGAVTSVPTAGGLIGVNGAGANVSYLYWDLAGTGRSNAIGPSAAATTNLVGIGGSSGVDVHSASSYTGFDFTNIWGIGVGASRPYLKTLVASAPRT
jgi:hypothetical protein